MAQQLINVGTVANDGTGDTLRVAFQKMNGNETDLYGRISTNEGNVAANNAAVLAMGIRVDGVTFLLVEKTVYVSKTGSDSNSGDSEEAALLTISAAARKVSNMFLGYGSGVTIQVGDGTYVESVMMGKVNGHGYVALKGNLSSPQNVILRGVVNVSTLAGASGADFSVKGFKLEGNAGGGSLLSATNGARIEFATIIFGSGNSGAPQVSADLGGTIVAVGSYTISAPGVFHIVAIGNGVVRCNGQAITIQNNPAFVFFVYSARGGVVEMETCTFSGTATGSRYQADSLGVIFTGGSATYLPGNSAGAVINGGIYR